MIAGLLDGIDPTALYSFLAIVLAGMGAYKLYLSTLVSRKQLRETPGSSAQPQPFIVQEAEVFVKTPDFNKKVAELKQEIGEVEGRVSEKLKHNETVFRDRFHKLDSDLQDIKTQAENRGELATQQFQNIEGRLGEVKSTLQHLTAQNATTNQKLDRSIENLPEAIAKAIERTHRK